jgi:hypothetical protein
MFEKSSIPAKWAGALKKLLSYKKMLVRTAI